MSKGTAIAAGWAKGLLRRAHLLVGMVGTLHFAHLRHRRKFPIQFSKSHDNSVVGPSFRGDVKHRTRNLEIPGLVLSDHPGMTNDGLLRRFAPRNDVKLRVRIPAARCARAVHEPFAQRGRGECRVPAAPAASCAKCWWHTSVATTGPPDSPGIPARNGFNGFLRALPGDRAFLSPSSAISRQLDAGVEASGPHDFAVRKSAPSS